MIMKFECEYNMKVKVEVYMPNEHSSTELQDKIREEGQKKLKYFLSGYLLDPDKKVIHENFDFKLKEV